MCLSPIEFSKRFCIFGNNFSKGDSKENTLLSISREYIWKQKATKQQLHINSWKNYLRYNLEIIRAATPVENITLLIEFDRNWATIQLHLH